MLGLFKCCWSSWLPGWFLHGKWQCLQMIALFLTTIDPSYWKSINCQALQLLHHCLKCCRHRRIFGTTVSRMLSFELLVLLPVRSSIMPPVAFVLNSLLRFISVIHIKPLSTHTYIIFSLAEIYLHPQDGAINRWGIPPGQCPFCTPSKLSRTLLVKYISDRTTSA